ncbi:hypothetical protein QNI16_36435 [Cytophagaceae bacterium YF14B1]|uniref:Uncharacterized protein n=1 Tax=Xanthocytophaga flava TaxID=3048013 RepID=A0AAE3QV42_9BACT|nr:hypothetical protein [Xanthocytophaga flavus]MDJ1486027.1 hypothetical protein [Xanthocytophaga flavus]
MKLINEITELMLENAAMNSDDPASGYHWDRIYDLIVQQDDSIILLFLDSLNDELMENDSFVGVLCSFLGYFVGHFQSKKILEAVDDLPKRFSHINRIEWLRSCVVIAKEAMDTEEQVLFEKKMNKLVAMEEGDLLNAVEKITDERTLIVLYSHLPDIIQRLKSKHLVDVMGENLYKLDSFKEKEWAYFNFQTAKDLL